MKGAQLVAGVGVAVAEMVVVVVVVVAVAIVVAVVQVLWLQFVAVVVAVVLLQLVPFVVAVVQVLLLQFVAVVVADEDYATRPAHAHDQLAYPPPHRFAPEAHLPDGHPAGQSRPPQLPSVAMSLPASSNRTIRPWTAPVLLSKRCPALRDLGNNSVAPIGSNRPRNKTELQTCVATAYGIQPSLHRPRSQRRVRGSKR